MSAASSGAPWDLRCEVREKLVAFLQRAHPGALPRQRAELSWRAKLERDATLDGALRGPPRAPDDSRESSRAARQEIRR